MAAAGPFRTGDGTRAKHASVESRSVCSTPGARIVVDVGGQIMIGDVVSARRLTFTLQLLGGAAIKVAYADVLTASLAAAYTRHDLREARRRQAASGHLRCDVPWPEAPREESDTFSGSSGPLSRALDAYLEKKGVQPTPFQLARRRQALRGSQHSARAARPEHVSERPENADSGDL